MLCYTLRYLELFRIIKYIDNIFLWYKKQIYILYYLIYLYCTLNFICDFISFFKEIKDEVMEYSIEEHRINWAYIKWYESLLSILPDCFGKCVAAQLIFFIDFQLSEFYSTEQSSAFNRTMCLTWKKYNISSRILRFIYYNYLIFKKSAILFWRNIFFYIIVYPCNLYNASILKIYLKL